MLKFTELLALLLAILLSVVPTTTTAQIFGGSGSNLTVGTTAISSGTTTKVLYDNAGVLGEYTVSGSGSICMTASCTLSGTTTFPTGNSNGAVSIQGTGGAGHTGIYWSAFGTPLISYSGNSRMILGPHIYMSSDGVYAWSATASGNNVDLTTRDTGFSRIAAGVIGAGTGAAAAVDGTIAATNYRITTKPFVLGTATTVASGGCTSPTAVTSNGTAAFSVGVGTGCSGSQPLVFTLPAATTGWNCYARNSTNGGTSVPRQSGAVSTTSVTITNYGATTGLAGAWSDSDNVVVSCLGY